MAHLLQTATRILDNPLGVADHPSWHDDAAYSPYLAAFLRVALADLACPPRDLSARQTLISAHYTRARLLMRHSLGMSLQRLNLAHSVAACSAELLSEGMTIQAYAEAAGLTFELEEFVAYAELLAERASIFRRIDRFGEAAADCLAALFWLDRYPLSDPLARRMLHLRLLSLLAFDLYMLGRFVDCWEYVTLGLRRCGSDPAARQYRASFLWFGALLGRLNGLAIEQGSSVLGTAIEAAKIVQQTGNRRSLVRIQCVVADIAADRIESQLYAPGSTLHDMSVHIATSAVADALPLASVENDAGGEALAWLAQARLDSLLNRNVNTPDAFERVLVVARRHADASLMTQAYTGLADHLRRAGELSAALHCYTLAIDAARTDVVGLGVRARRAQEHSHEWAP